MLWADPPFVAALDRSIMALAHMQQMLLLGIDDLSKCNNFESLFFTLTLHLMKCPSHLGYVIPQAVPDCVAVYMLQMRFLQQPIIDTAVMIVMNSDNKLDIKAAFQAVGPCSFQCHCLRAVVKQPMIRFCSTVSDPILIP